MPTTLKKPRPEKSTTETLQEKFDRLDAAWVNEVGHYSSSAVLRNHWAYREMVSLGEEIVPVLLRDVEKGPSLWCWALHEITGEIPFPQESRGNIEKICAAWVRWGKEQGYQW
jgi:hypothetical protein